MNNGLALPSDLDPRVLGDGIANLENLELQLTREELRLNLYKFLVAAWSHVEPHTPFVHTWHVEELCKILQDITLHWHTTPRRWIFNVPPGTLKSILVNVVWPAWVWARKPECKFLAASYGLHLSIRDNLRLRDLVLSSWYQELYPRHMTGDQNTKTRFKNDASGWRIATSVGGVGTGEHPHVIVIDDPTTAQQAVSEPERTAANSWFDRTVSSRGIAQNVLIIVIMQRLHIDDLSGYLLSRGGWEHVRFPMRYELEDPDPRDKRFVEDQLLCPDIISENKVKQLELDLGPDAAAQLQQKPTPEGGGLFKREWFKFVDAAPLRARRARGWDTAGTEGGGDYTVGVKISEALDAEGRATGQFFVEDVQRAQLGPDGVDKLIHFITEQDGKGCAQREEKEGGSAGLAVIQARAKTLKGYDYAGVPVSGSKATRAKPFRAQVEAGNVALVRAVWNEEYIRELCTFPSGKHDDQLDGSSAAFNAVLLEPVPYRSGATWGKRT